MSSIASRTSTVINKQDANRSLEIQEEQSDILTDLVSVLDTHRHELVQLLNRNQADYVQQMGALRTEMTAGYNQLRREETEHHNFQVALVRAVDRLNFNRLRALTGFFIASGGLNDESTREMGEDLGALRQEIETLAVVCVALQQSRSAPRRNEILEGYGLALVLVLLFVFVTFLVLILNGLRDILASSLPKN
ncbi:hypothetical protein Hte_012449 [Hypoxylon texense]